MKPDIRVLAVEAGDLLKSETALNEIDRFGAAVFRVAVEPFPMVGITSQRAKSIFNWLCTVGRTEMEPTARSQAVRTFLHQLAHHKPELCTRLDDALRRASFDVPGTTAAPPDVTALQNEERAKRRAQFERTRGALLTRFEELATSGFAQTRGYALQDLLNELLALHQVPAAKSFTRSEGGEQIDGAFELDGWYYLVECRWRRKPADGRDLDGLLGQVARSGRQTMGLFLSMNGWSPNVVPLLKQNPNKSILLTDGVDLYAVLSGGISFQDLLRAKRKRLNLAAEPFYPYREIALEHEA
ncbi:hypothetical protein [Corallococcus aberystwythensis]|uniref:Restriction endonuclease type IV Mrr domain-containing protein n=1 Tax=Corallococcus aberystwythensis TaxID=2316722 RepID=A0A3A8QWW9_9BACT|nr:hypothetical protein [Corallococcus aberystwythensis]RKH73183.1 hypothetical protein D7W81_04700 [Corallococcus aberystwythensis]